MRILVTGASSLVGFSILESLEGRRNGLEVVGLASDDINSEAQRYDYFEVVPLSQGRGFVGVLEAQIDRWRPALVLAGRDPDIAHLADIRQRREDLRSVIVTGDAATAAITSDKALTTTFAKEHQLPWAPTAVCGPHADLGDVASHRLPWIVKPVDGAGSHGIFVITDPRQIPFWRQRPGYVIQPLLGGPREIPAPDTEFGVPWFTDVGDPWQRSVQVVLDPAGQIAGHFCSDHTLHAGITQTSRVADDPHAVAIGLRWARHLAQAGWRGSLNIQMKVDPDLGPVPFEINARMSGATHGRLRLGFDEVGLTLAAWTGFSLEPGPSPCRSVHYRPRAYPGPVAPTATTERL